MDGRQREQHKHTAVDSKIEPLHLGRMQRLFLLRREVLPIIATRRAHRYTEAAGVG
ncbi:hypothetical protein CBM2585_A130046 [Cupriavidus taiwanensis]|nr:hypothetical protein CBM2585_A130046 [Cupriavidus taiwanensis]